MNEIAQWIGYGFMASVGVLAVALMIFCAGYLANKAGWYAWGRMSSLYRIESMKYWFSRLQKSRLAEFRKFEKDSKK